MKLLGTAIAAFALVFIAGAFTAAVAEHFDGDDGGCLRVLLGLLCLLGGLLCGRRVARGGGGGRGTGEATN